MNTEPLTEYLAGSIGCLLALRAQFALELHSVAVLSIALLQGPVVFQEVVIQALEHGVRVLWIRGRRDMGGEDTLKYSTMIARRVDSTSWAGSELG